MTNENTKNIHQRMAASKAGRERNPHKPDYYKNRNLHSVKFPDDLEEDYAAWKGWHNLNDNAALRHLVQTHPDLKKKPEQ